MTDAELDALASEVTSRIDLVTDSVGRTRRACGMRGGMLTEARLQFTGALGRVPKQQQ